ncbi:Bug family tripartite tricarboxylate transporter substrate binding protein [Falsiroseomonas oryziterrae]|uniref:Bug family tripartite tricarboxylate transporter substrate binding protein n=1 Tax=Falsiroseomonas oryziterrae TaxID=2911368 RepID=UPI001F2C823A|nr:tripartite tricarboxylate transporter substrate binding protein [Roseomonas sp. NPKOSM-4]
MISRRQTLAAAAATALLPHGARAQEPEFPSRPLRMIVPFAPGGASDIIARIIQPTLGNVFGRPIVIDNRAGATGNIGMEAAARAAPDGYTMVLGNAGSTVINPGVQTLPWSPTRDLTGVTLVAETPNIVVVNPSLPVQNIRELVEYVRARPGVLNYGSAGSASQNRLEMEVFMKQQGLQVVNVPYRGGAGPAVNGLMAGDVQIMFVTLPSVLAPIQAGRVRALAVTTAERFPGLPDVPTLLEQGYPDNVSSSWQGMMAPAGTPPAIVQRLHAGITTALRDEGVRRRLIDAGAVAAPSPDPAHFTRFVAAEFTRWRGIIQDVGATPD